MAGTSESPTTNRMWTSKYMFATVMVIPFSPSVTPIGNLNRIKSPGQTRMKVMAVTHCYGDISGSRSLD
jgi:hypothetical protein